MKMIIMKDGERPEKGVNFLSKNQFTFILWKLILKEIVNKGKEKGENKMLKKTMLSLGITGAILLGGSALASKPVAAASVTQVKTITEAVNEVKGQYPGYDVSYDHSWNGCYVIQVYRIVKAGGTTMTDTLDWLTVDPKMGKTESIIHPAPAKVEPAKKPVVHTYKVEKTPAKPVVAKAKRPETQAIKHITATVCYWENRNHTVIVYTRTGHMAFMTTNKWYPTHLLRGHKYTFFYRENDFMLTKVNR